MFARLRRPVMIAVPALLMVTAFQNCSPNSDAPLYKTSTQSSTTAPASTSSATDDTTAGTKTCRVFLTSGNSWTVPNDFNSTNNTIEAIGNGADGGGNTRAGGGGGAYSKSVNVALNPGAIVAYSVAHTGMYWPGPSTSGHTTGINSGDSWLCNSSSCTSMASSGVVVGAAGGKSSTNGPYGQNSIDGQGGLGGDAASGKATGPGALKYSGGNGGSCKNYDCTYNPSSEPGSGGGAAGPHGNGMPGGAGMGMGGAGDAGYGGGGGGINQRGGNGTTWDATHGAGGGGGGSQQFTPGGNGGNYGGGGGGGGNDGMRNPPVANSVGGGGIIVVTWQGTTCS